MNATAENWDKVAEGYTTEIDGSERELADELIEILKKHGLTKGSKLLEIGSGSGHLSACLNIAGYETDLLDFSKTSLAKAQETFEKHGLVGEFYKLDIMDMADWQTGGHDLAWNSGVMEHFDDDTLAEALKYIAKTARSALIVVPNPKSISYLLMRYIRQAENDWPYGKEYLRINYIGALKAAGFENIETYYVGKSWTSHNFRLAMKDAQYVDAYEDMLERGLLPEHEKYLVAYFATPGGADFDSTATTDVPARAKTEFLTDISDLHAERFGVEMKLRNANNKIEEETGRADWFKTALGKKEAELTKLEEDYEYDISRMETELESANIRFEQEKSLLYYEIAGNASMYEQDIIELEERHRQDKEKLIAELESTKKSLEIAITTEKCTKQSLERAEQSLGCAEQSLDCANQTIAKALANTNKLFETRLFKLLHFLNRVGKQLIKGSWSEKMNFFKWLKAHITRQHYVDRGYNPIQEITDVLEGIEAPSVKAPADTADTMVEMYPEFDGVRALYVYKWATMGGCERVFLNRARTFKNRKVNVKIDVYFFHNSGGLRNFLQYIEKFRLSDYIRVVTQFDESKYDFITTFDTQEVFDIISDSSKVLVECHTPYAQMRSYLQTLPQDIIGICSPSEAFLELVVQKEVPEHFKNKLYVLPNFYNDESSSFGVTAVARKWDKKPICYVGRMDSLKNTKELLEIFAKLIEKHDEYVLVLAGNVMPDYMDLDAQIHSHELIGKVNALGAIPFEDVRGLLACVKMSDGIFVSPSLGESFGLSVLEAMANEIPVVITDIECHKALVNNDDAFIYKQGNIYEAVSKILSIGSGANYEKAGKQVMAYSENFNIDSFLKSWNDLIGEICAKLP